MPGRAWDSPRQKKQTMTKSRDHKHAIRAYMAAHGVNYTTAQRALDAATKTPLLATCPVVDPDTTATTSVSSEPDVALDTTSHIVPDPDDLTCALVALSRDELVMGEHTNDPESPVTDNLLRLAVHAAGTHGAHRPSKWQRNAHEVCRSALLGLEITAGPETLNVDGQYPVDPADLAAALHQLADDDMALTEHATEHGFHELHLWEALTRLAKELEEPLPPLPDRLANRIPHPAHYLTIKATKLSAEECADLTAEEIGEYRADPDREFEMDCPGITQAHCEGWEECSICSHSLTEADIEEREQTGIVHGVEHQSMSYGWSTAMDVCSLQAFHDAWQDSATDLNLPEGRYAVGFDWDEVCYLDLVIR